MLSLMCLSAWAVELGDDAHLAVNDDLELRLYRGDSPLPDTTGAEDLGDYAELVNRLNAQLFWGVNQLGLQLDTVALFANSYYLDDELVLEHALVPDTVQSPLGDQAFINVEKVWYTRRLGDVEVQVGDGYAAYGRGMALNLVRNVDIDVDTSLLGAQANAALGDWDLTVVSGITNRQQVLQDNPNVLISPERGHMVSGARVDRYGLGPANVGAHGVVYSFAGDDGGTYPYGGFSQYGAELDAMVAGATVEAFGIGGIDWFLEGDVFAYQSEELFSGDELSNGYAAYASAAAYPGKVTLLFEGKHYVDAYRLNSLVVADGYAMVNGPTLEYERAVTEDSAAALGSNDISGGRVRADLAVKPAVLIPYASLAVFRDRDLGGLHFNQAPETVVHPVGGVDWIGDTLKLLTNVGYRVDRRDGATLDVDGDGIDEANQIDLGADRLAHVDVDFRFPFFADLGAEVSADVKRFWWGDNRIQQTDFTEGTLALAVHMHGGWTFIGYQDFTDNPLVQSSGNLDDHLYGAAEVQYKPNSSTTIKAFYGAYKAGIRCAGGQCKSLPGFDGARLSVSTAF